MTIRLLRDVIRDQRVILAVGLIVAVAMGSIVLATAARQYQATATLVVTAPGLLPAEPERPFEGAHITNPLTRDDGSLADVAQLLVADATRDLSPGSPVTVNSGLTQQFLPPPSPFIAITATGAAADDLRRAVAAQADRLRVRLAAFQQEVGVRDTTAMTLQTVSPPTVARVGLLTSTGTSLAGALAAFLIAVLIAFARVDGAALDRGGAGPPSGPVRVGRPMIGWADSDDDRGTVR
ncbi:hypothetical protein [Actinomycetospora chiangmaiensis]|uniref:hypothetical protein n=1 Tax=Actinomycetospora chiangmaiensis TaxID=402650 RepID=UPI00037CC470|nr:hypothetical protein [Actinomycetospora chiangmaiensis]